MTDLLDPAVRADVTMRLGELWAGRPVILGPSVLAAWTPYVEWFVELGCPVMLLATSRGAGEIPDPGTCQVVEIESPPTATVTEEMRTHDRLARNLSAEARTAIDEFDPDCRGVWFTSPFVTTDEPIDGRPVTGGRPASFLELEDKMLADAVWDAAGVARPPARIVPVERDAVAAAVSELRNELGAVCVGDNREGYNGLGEYVRWVQDADDLTQALAFYAPRCDRVRVTPFLDGVPCSIHGFVLPDGTAALRPVEIVMLRDHSRRRLVFGGLGTTWDPPPAEREAMRDAVRRVGAHLQHEHGYRGAFGIDGVLTADGFRPTELNSRMPAGATLLASIDRRFFTFLQAVLVAGVDTGLTAADVEALVALMDQTRSSRTSAFAPGTRVDSDETYPIDWDGLRFARSVAETGRMLSVGVTPTGLFVKVEPDVDLSTGDRLAPVNTALLAYVDHTYGSSFGRLEPAPDLRA